jgi:hypothetical protein
LECYLLVTSPIQSDIGSGVVSFTNINDPLFITFIIFQTVNTEVIDVAHIFAHRWVIFPALEDLDKIEFIGIVKF